MNIGFFSDAAIAINAPSLSASLILFGQWLFGLMLFLLGFFVLISTAQRYLGPWGKVEKAYPLHDISGPTKWFRCSIKAGRTSYGYSMVGIAESGVRVRLLAVAHRQVQIPWQSISSIEIQTLQMPLWRRLGRNLETYLCVIEVLEPVKIEILGSARKVESLLDRYAGEKVLRATYHL